MNDYHTKRAVEILRKIRYATIATASKNGKPWNSPVAHEYDDQLNIYWFSDRQNQHSQNVRENEDVFMVIYDSTVPEGEGEGVYIEAKAVEINDAEEIVRVRKLKKGEDYQVSANEFLGDAIRRMYKAVPKRVWMNDAEVKDGVFLRDYKVELSLDTLRELLSEESAE
ncbi:pyridoxamine 5'-phosphate oxidase family protein [Candidatus Saccharibacteria bacterium]|nr:MAG: pyridoxamine 5'-phosphate oxidase family protein [Candidatus Saccharibacteria bacterium]